MLAPPDSLWLHPMRSFEVLVRESDTEGDAVMRAEARADDSRWVRRAIRNPVGTATLLVSVCLVALSGLAGAAEDGADPRGGGPEGHAGDRSLARSGRRAATRDRRAGSRRSPARRDTSGAFHK